MSDALSGLLAEPLRARAFGAVALGAGSIEEVAAAADGSVRDVAVAVRRLVDHLVLVETDDGLRVDYDGLRASARARATRPDPEDHGYADDRAESVLRTFVRDGRLRRLPAQWTKKKIVLHHIAARSFDEGVRYSEAQTNEALAGWCDGGITDHVTLRRLLVDLHLLRRERNEYWLDEEERPDPGVSH